MEPKQQIEQLTRELEHAGYLYYVLDNPEMSDYDYDHKLRQLEELEAQYPQYASPLSPTRRVGGQALSEFVKVRHAVPLNTPSSRRSTGCPWRWNTWTAALSAARPAATASSVRT